MPITARMLKVVNDSWPLAGCLCVGAVADGTQRQILPTPLVSSQRRDRIPARSGTHVECRWAERCSLAIWTRRPPLSFILELSKASSPSAASRACCGQVLRIGQPEQVGVGFLQNLPEALDLGLAVGQRSKCPHWPARAILGPIPSTRFNRQGRRRGRRRLDLGGGCSGGVHGRGDRLFLFPGAGAIDPPPQRC